MSKPATLLKAADYILKCTLAAGLFMFVFMALGELFVDPQMFRGFLAKPHIWPLIFLESAVWMTPLALFSLPVLWSLRKLEQEIAVRMVIACWASLGITAIIAYKITYHSHAWSLAEIAKAEILFGWTLPCISILIANAALSLRYLSFIRGRSQALRH